MRLVLDLLSILILQNPNIQTRESLKADFLSVLVSIIARKSMRPLVKSCISALTVFMTKLVFTLEDVSDQYESVSPDLAGQPVIILWQNWVAEVFRWMDLHYICPVAGKFLVTIFIELYSSSKDSERKVRVDFDVTVLRKWLESALCANPDILESVKNYVLAPLFKADRGLSVALLEELNTDHPDYIPSSTDVDLVALLHLAALEVGKKLSIVDDPSKFYTSRPHCGINSLSNFQVLLGVNKPQILLFLIGRSLNVSLSITHMTSVPSPCLYSSHLRPLPNPTQIWHLIS